MTVIKNSQTGKIELAKSPNSTDPEFVRKVAELRYEHKLTPADITQQFVVLDGDQITTHKVQRALTCADKTCVRHIVTRDDDVLLDLALAQQLQDIYGLHDAIVVKPPNEEIAYNASNDDDRHYLLGRALGDYIRKNIRPHDHIATVGGRGTYFVAHSMATDPRVDPNFQQVHISAISGRMATSTHSTNSPNAAPSVDADDAAFYLAKAICSDPGKQLHHLHLPVAYPDGYDATSADEFNHVLQQEEKMYPCGKPTIGLFGVGRLGAGHMFAKTSKRVDVLSDDIASINAALKNRPDNCTEEFGDDAFLPIADVANRVFPIYSSLDKGTLNKLEKPLADMNKKIVGLSFTQLADIPLLIFNASGTYKIPAIYTVLRFRRPNGMPFSNVLCTDSVAASRLIALARKKGVEKINIQDLPGET